MAVLIEGARQRRAEAWLQNSTLCSMIGNLMSQVNVLGSNKTPKSIPVADFMPEAFMDIYGMDRTSTAEETEALREEMIRRDREITDRTNERRIEMGLKPRPYKVI